MELSERPPKGENRAAENGILVQRTGADDARGPEGFGQAVLEVMVGTIDVLEENRRRELKQAPARRRKLRGASPEEVDALISPGEDSEIDPSQRGLSPTTQ
jgi:hypothetical protein